MISNGNKNFSVQFEPHAVMPKAVFLNFLALMVEAKGSRKNKFTFWRSDLG